MKYILYVMAFLCHGWLWGQQTKPLTVGDSVPAAVMQPILNAQPGKLIILDFFATWCGACIGALPRMDSLQTLFGDSLSIWVVGYQSTDIINRFLETNARVKNIHLPFLTGDTLLNRTFPHYLIPHEVWIKKGKVIAITDAEALTPTSIRAALSDTGVQLPVKIDRLDFNPSISLRMQLAVGDSSLYMRQNLFTRQVEGLGTRRGTQITHAYKRVYFINWGLLSLFQYAWKFPANRVILNLNDPSIYLNRTSNPDEWKRNNLFCYEGVFPSDCPDSLIMEDLKSSLQSASPLQGSWQKRNLPCYVLSSEGSGPLPSRLLHTIFKKDTQTDSIVMKRHTLEAITAICNDATQPSPGKPIIVNETGIAYPIDLVIPSRALSDPVVLQKSLAPYHLQLIPAIRELSVFVLTANPFYNTPGKK
jgi:thiol-disulfide isomerase/thioredoxin